jgi:hypothetical protein
VSDKIPICRMQRNRYLTQEEAAGYREQREKARQEYESGNVQIGSMTMGDWYDLKCLLADLKEARQAKGLNLAELSRLSGVAGSKLPAIESDPQGDVNLNALVQYARAVGKRLTMNLEEMPEPAGQTR